MTINLFIRQPFTQTFNQEQTVVQNVLNTVKEMDGNDFQFNYLTGIQAESADTFKNAFETKTGKKFTPKNFRDYRLSALNKAEAFLYIRVGLSESSAFELAYNIFKGNKAPIFFAIWKNTPIKTTLLRDLEDLCDITYVEFDHPDELKNDLKKFFKKIENNKK